MKVRSSSEVGDRTWTSGSMSGTVAKLGPVCRVCLQPANGVPGMAERMGLWVKGSIQAGGAGERERAGDQ